MQRLTNLCSVLNDMEPICVLNHVFVLREVSASFQLCKLLIVYKFWITSLSEESKIINLVKQLNLMVLQYLCVLSLFWIKVIKVDFFQFSIIFHL